MENKQNKSELELIKDLLLTWIKHWYYFLISLAICGAIGFAYLKLKTPEFSIKSKVSLRNDEIGGGISSSSSVMSSLGLGRGSGYNIEDEANKMASQGSVKNIVANLKLNNQYILEEFFGFWKTDLYKVSPVEVSYDESLPENLMAIMQFNLSVDGNKIKIKAKANKDKLGTYEFNSFPCSISTPYGDFVFSKTSFFKNEPFNLKIVVTNLDFMAQVYRGTFIVEFEKKNSSILNLDMVDYDVTRAKDILLESISTYNKESQDEKSYVGDRTLAFLNERLKMVEKDLYNADENIRKFKDKYKLTDIETDAAVFLEQNAELQSKLIEAETQLKIISMADEFITDPSKKYEPIPFYLSVSDKALSEMIMSYNTQLQKVESFLKSPGKEKNTLISEYDYQLNISRQTLLKSLSNIKEGTQIVVNDLKKKEKEFGKRIGEVPAMERGFIELKREQEIQQTIYVFLLERREETAVKSISILPKLKIIDQPYVIIKPVTPNTFKVALMVVFIGGVLIPLSLIYLIPNILKKRRKGDK